MPDQHQNIEHEAKFVITSPQEAGSLTQRLSSVAQELALGLEAGGAVPVTDTYLDTPAYELLRAGLALRQRNTDGRRTIGLKQIGNMLDGHDAIHQRLDLEFPLENEQPKHWPAELRELLASHLAGLKALRPIVCLHQTRQRQFLLAQPQATPDNAYAAPISSGNRLIEWSLDDVQVRMPNTVEDKNADNSRKKKANKKQQASADAPVTHNANAGSLHELEIERLIPDAEPAFQQLVARMAQTESLLPIQTSKLERALDLLTARRHGVETLEIIGEMPLPEACRLILHTQCNIILRLEHRVRRGDDPEAVHDMRVAIRRARAALRLLGDGFRPRDHRHLQNGFKALGTVLGRARDLDVALDNLKKFRKNLPKSQRKQLEPLRQSLKYDRELAQNHILAWLQDSKHHTFVAELVQFCSTPGKGVRRRLQKQPQTDKLTPTRVDHRLPSIILDCFEKVRAYETVLHGDELPPLETFHALRIQTKYLRYSLEFARHLLGEPGDTLIAQMKEVQDQLGQLNDASVERTRLQTWQQELPDNEALTLRLQAVQKQLDELAAAIPSMHRRFTSPHQRELLGLALARI